jgi:3-phosphoshikimate 1-carboxyvinyltransferase
VEEGDDVAITGAPVLHRADVRGARATDLGELDCGRSGTTMRLAAGIVAGSPVRATLTGDPQLLRRPMGRVAEPLRRMGARIALGSGDRPPLVIEGGQLRGIDLDMAVASAQVKSAVLLAGLFAEGPTLVCETAGATRDHTERLLAAMGARIDVAGEGATRTVRVRPGPLSPLDLSVPGDLSSAAFVLTAAAIVPGSDVVVDGVGLNPTRTAFVDVMRAMGADIDVGANGRDGDVEPVGSIRLKGANLRGIAIGTERIPGLIDELPLVGLLGALAEGVTEIRGAGELRVKESDRIAGLVAGLRALGADTEELPDGFAVRGGAALHGGECDARGDHRLAMTFAVAGLVASGPVRVIGLGFAADSFPGFTGILARLAGGRP